MRLQLYFDLENDYIEIDYRKSFVSFIKKAISEYHEDFYEKLYHDKAPIIKPITFAIFFEGAIYFSDRIEVKKQKIRMTVSTNNYEYAINLLNSFNHQKYKKFSLCKNSMTLYQIQLLKEKQISTNEIVIKMQSPIIVKSKEDQRDTYYYAEKELFKPTLITTIKDQLKAFEMDEALLDGFDIIPVQPKKIIVKCYGINLECSIGIFKLIGKIELLEYLYQVGLGSKRSLGFGCFNIL